MKVGNLEAKRDFSDVHDVVAAYELLCKKGVAGQAYNVCSGKTHSIQEILNILLGMTDKKIDVLKDEKRMRPSEIPVIYGDNSKIKKDCNWQGKIQIDNTLLDALEWWRERVCK